VRWAWLAVAFAVLYGLALLLFAIGTWGLFGQARDPLAGVYLMPLGAPWVWLLDAFSDRALPWMAAMCPAINLALLVLLGRRDGRE